jgi:hypothetical protein
VQRRGEAHAAWSLGPPNHLAAIQRRVSSLIDDTVRVAVDEILINYSIEREKRERESY